MQINDDRCECENNVIPEEKMLNTFSRRFRSMAFRYTQDFDRAEDLAQDIFLRIFQNLTTFDKKIGCFESWAFRLGKNLIIDHYRISKKYRVIEGNEYLEDVIPSKDRSRDPFHRLYSSEQRELILEAIGKLPRKLKEAITLRHLEDLTYEEIGKILDIPAGTVKSRINRARLALARTLKYRMTGADHHQMEETTRRTA
jgi:RNA polymerase sigma-70 factor (ECF subfamily)